MPSFSDKLDKLHLEIKEMEPLIKLAAELVQANFILLIAARADQQLQQGIIMKMIPLSNTKRDRIFEDYGPLAHFSPKIDIAHALNVIDTTLYDDLRVVNSIRVKFAHSPETVTFQNDEVLKDLRKLSGSKKQDFANVDVCRAALNDVLRRLVTHIKLSVHHS